MRKILYNVRSSFKNNGSFEFMENFFPREFLGMMLRKQSWRQNEFSRIIRKNSKQHK